MKTIYNCVINKKNTVLITLLTLLLFSGCKKNKEEVNSSVIEAKLITKDNEYWDAPIAWDNDACSTPFGNVSLALNDNHSFIYNNSSCSYSGSWTVDYKTNRSGQFLNLNLLFKTPFIQQSFLLKYSPENDTFYAFHSNDLTLEPFTRIPLQR